MSLCPRYLSSWILRVIALVVAVGLSACGSAEKYQKEPQTATDTREFVIPMSPGDQDYARAMTGKIDSADLALSLGDSARAIHIVDSVLGIAESVVDTITFEAPLNRFLLFLMNDGYAKIVAWESDTAAVGALTRRYEDLAVRLQERRDSFNTQQGR